MKALLIKLLRSEEGQDLIEYALLTAGTGFAGIAAWPAIVNTLGVVYAQLDTQTQELWAPCDPGETYPCP
jgi:Flp pilus assembly pilin Flp